MPGDADETRHAVEIRRATAADAPALSALQSALAEPSPELLDAAVDGLVGTLLVAAVPENRVAGYLLGVDGQAAGTADDASEDDAAYVAELVVAPGHRRRGVGSELLAAYLDSLAAGTRVTVTVAADDGGAQAFYAAHDFERRETLPERFDAGAILLGRRA